MSVRFLTPEWAEAVTTALNADEDMRSEVARREQTVCWHVGMPDGSEVHYHLAMQGGVATMALGEPAHVDLDLFASYDDVVLISTGALNGRVAFQGKRLRSPQRLIGVLKYLGVFHNLNRVVAALDVDY